MTVLEMAIEDVQRERRKLRRRLGPANTATEVIVTEAKLDELDARLLGLQAMLPKPPPPKPTKEEPYWRKRDTNNERGRGYHDGYRSSGDRR